MKIKNELGDVRHHGVFVIKPGETVDVTSDESANWLVRHGCTEVDKTIASTDPVMNVPVVKPTTRKKRISRRD